MAQVERKNYTQEEITEIAKEFPVTLFGDRVVITANSIAEDELNLSDSSLDEVQYVVAAGNTAERYIKAEDKVLLDLKKLIKNVPVQNDQYQTVPEIDLEPFVYGEHIFAIIDVRQLKGKYNA